MPIGSPLFPFGGNGNNALHCGSDKDLSASLAVAEKGRDAVFGSDGSEAISRGMMPAEKAATRFSPLFTVDRRGDRLFGYGALDVSGARRRKPPMAAQLRARPTIGAPSRFFTTFAAKPVGHVPNANHTTDYECSKGSFK